MLNYKYSDEIVKKIKGKLSMRILQNYSPITVFSCTVLMYQKRTQRNKDWISFSEIGKIFILNFFFF